MAKNWANGLPNEGRSPESGYPMAAEGMPFPWRANGGTISTNLDGIWGMSVEEAVLMATHDIYHACTRLSKRHNRV
jgi:hypothetical protein